MWKLKFLLLNNRKMIWKVLILAVTIIFWVFCSTIFIPAQYYLLLILGGFLLGVLTGLVPSKFYLITVSMITFIVGVGSGATVLYFGYWGGLSWLIFSLLGYCVGYAVFRKFLFNDRSHI